MSTHSHRNPSDVGRVDRVAVTTLASGWLEALSGFTEYTCLTVACVGCGQPHVDEDDNTLHLPSRAAAILHADATEFWTLGPQGMWCPQCHWDAHAAERAATERAADERAVVEGGLR